MHSMLNLKNEFLFRLPKQHGTVRLSHNTTITKHVPAFSKASVLDLAESGHKLASLVC